MCGGVPSHLCRVHIPQQQDGEEAAGAGDQEAGPAEPAQQRPAAHEAVHNQQQRRDGAVDDPDQRDGERGDELVPHDGALEPIACADSMKGEDTK